MTFPKFIKSLRPFSFSFIATAVVLTGVGLLRGWAALITTVILIVIEVTFSFDNAILNAKILARLSPAWQKAFLSVGIVIAIFGMRIVFPIVIVMLSAHLPWHEVLNLALNHPHEYAHKLEAAHPSIAAFGGGFLLTLALYFFLDDRKDVHWLRKLERPIASLSSWWPPLIAVLFVALVAIVPGNHHVKQTFVAGLLGIGTYVVLNLLTEAMEKLTGSTAKAGTQTGMAALVTFIYLEVLDASFSFDGVIGAFAITSMVLLIAAGLGAGAVWVRSLTVFMVHQGTLSNYKYLEHGAHYTVAMLALLLFLSLIVTVPDAVSGGLGLVIIGLALRASVIEKNLRGA